ncbi:hypothetical protein AXF42_Ash020770 [Apostasia shenzhenica]|uniref:Uncharacterized protein n=1 Tax=Apostasia shenzhenica TaxID=1088818 RepID=A0A2I0APX8_9ASPA|nr:hypothetical protein AXF42_Ash020770 [Apostasia shenzhenica]
MLLKDKDIGRLPPKVGATTVGGSLKTPLVVCGPAPLGKPASPLLATGWPSFPFLPSASAQNDEKKKKEEKEKKGKGEKEKKERKEEVSHAVLEAALSIEGAGRSLGERVYEIKREEEKVLNNTSQIVEVVKIIKKNQEEEEGRYRKRVVKLESALLQATKCSLAIHREELRKLYRSEEKLASLTLSNSEWAGKAEAVRGEFHRTVFEISQAYFAYVKDLQKRIKELDDENEALRKERDVFKVQVAEFEAESKAREDEQERMSSRPVT